MRLDRLDADPQIISNLLVQSPSDHPLEHLALAGRQPLHALFQFLRVEREAVRVGGPRQALANQCTKALVAEGLLQKIGCALFHGVHGHRHVAVTGHGDVPMAVDTMKKGAADFLQKPFSDERLCALVRECLARAADSHRLALDAKELEERMERLTSRERQVLERVVAGRLNKQIADDLGISIKTVEAHRSNIMEKLLARSMAELMRIAIRARVGAAAADH